MPPWAGAWKHYIWGVRERRITNRGFLLGPCCPIYGAGMVGITLLFQDSHYSYWHVFFSIICCAA